MQEPNVKIDWYFEDALVFIFDFNQGECIYHYRPEDGNLDVDSKSREYDRAEWYIGESPSLCEYIADQAELILQRFTQVVLDEFQNGYVDMFQLHEDTQYAKFH